MIPYFAFPTVSIKLFKLIKVNETISDCRFKGLKGQSIKRFSLQTFLGKSSPEISWSICGRTAATTMAFGRSESSESRSTSSTSSTIVSTFLTAFRAAFTGSSRFLRGASLTSRKLRPETIQVRSIGQ